MSLTNLNDDDWGELLAGETITLGKTILVIEPMGLFKLRKLGMKLKAILTAMAEHDISAFNFEDPENLSVIAGIIADQAPEMIEEATGLDRNDFCRLPIGKAVELIRVVLDVNISSQEGLIKNLSALGEIVSAKMNPASLGE